MKRKIAEILRNKKIAAGCAAAALAVIIGSVAVVQDSRIPELPVYTDPVMEVTLEEEETPLASAPTVKTTTKKDTSTKKVTMKSASKKTYTKKLPTTKKTTTATSSTSKAVIETETTVSKAVTEKYTKKSKVKTVTTVTTTTVTTTTTEKAAAATSNSSGVSSGTTVKPQTGKYSAQITQIAPKMDSRVLNAYEKLGFAVEVDSSVSYAGHFDAATRKIIMKQADDTIYHELGHFVSFITGNTDKSAAFQSVYSLEKSKFTGINKAYATQNSSEYFAESMKDYIVQPAALKSSRPQTYQAIVDALNKITDAQVTKVLTIYGPVWNR